jgi:hypothetical protein
VDANKVGLALAKFLAAILVMLAGFSAPAAESSHDSLRMFLAQYKD